MTIEIRDMRDDDRAGVLAIDTSFETSTIFDVVTRPRGLELVERTLATPLVKRYVRYGASPRAAQALVLAGKINALTRGQAFVSVEDIRAVALPALRHRVLLNFEGEAEQVNPDTIVGELLAGLPADA